MDAAEDDVFRAAFRGFVGGELGEFERVAAEVGVGDDGVLLVVVAEDEQVVAELFPTCFDGGVEFVVAHGLVCLGKRRLPEHGGSPGSMVRRVVQVW